MCYRIVFLLASGALVLATGGCCGVSRSQSADADLRREAMAREAWPKPVFALKSDAPRDLGPILAPVISRANIPGMSALVLQGDRIVAQGVAGVRKLGNATPIALGDEFEICSCAKAMTASLVALLAEEGRLTLHTTLGEIFSATVKDLSPAWEKVTLQQLLDHQAGLTDQHMIRFLTSVMFSSSPTQQRLSFARKILAHPPDYPPGGKAVYNSADYMIVAAALETLTGRTWEELIRQKLFAPLGITTAGFGPPGISGQVVQPWGHGPRRLLYVNLPGATDHPIDPGSCLSADYPMAAEPAGLVHMSVHDWATFVGWQLRGAPANPSRDPAFLTPQSFDQLQVAVGGPIFASPSAQSPMQGAGYVSGWFTDIKPWAKGPRPGDSGRVLFHQGDNGRWNCVVWIAPEIDFAVVVACNRTAMWSECDRVVAALIREFAPKFLNPPSPRL